MPQCVAWGCTNKSGITQGKTFHRFPKDPERRAAWITALRRVGFEPGDNTRLCGDHFEDDCFILSGKPRLREDAVPSVFNFPSHLKTITTHRKLLKDWDLGESSSADEDASPEEAAVPVVPDFSLEHSYCLIGPRNLKRRLDNALEKFEENRKKLRAVKARNQKLQKQVTSLASVVENLTDENLVSESCVALLEPIFTGVPIHLMKRIMMSRSDVKSAVFHPALKAFALTLLFYSTKAYDYVRETFGLGLPCESTIRRWYSSIDGKPGFSAEILDTLKKKADEATAAGEEVLYSMMMGEMAIQKFVEWDGKKMTGYVDIGTNIVDNTTTPYATEALVFLLVAVNSSWKVPAGYFLIHKLSGSEKANLVKQCLMKVHETGVKVISLTCDYPPSHFSMLKELGACMDPQNLDPSFPHPAGNGQKVFVMLDVCQMLKLAQNVFCMCSLLRDKDGNIIRWKFLEDLHDVQQREGLHFTNKLHSTHLHWQSQKLKVKLAAQTLSSSVADALEFCRDGLQLEEFRNCEGTVHFIRLIDNLFDVLNSRNRFSRGMKSAMKPEMEEQTMFFLDYAYNYIASIQDIAGNRMVATAKRTPFIAFMAAIQSVKALYKLYVGEGKPLQYFLTCKLSQDHLELFFGAVRAAGGFNNNPTSKQFLAAFKRLMCYDVTVVTRNAVPQDHTSVLTSLSATSAMKKSTIDPSEDIMVARRYDLDQPEDHQEETLPEIPDLPELSIFKEAAVRYIAGFVVDMVAKRSSCPECQSALITTKALPGSQPRQWLTIQKPSESVINICQVTERLLRKVMLKTDQTIPRGHGIPDAIGYTILKEVGGRVFRSLDGHMMHTEPDNNHVFPLIKTVTHAYIKIRMHHLAKQHITCI